MIYIVVDIQGTPAFLFATYDLEKAITFLERIEQRTMDRKERYAILYIGNGKIGTMKKGVCA